MVNASPPKTDFSSSLIEALAEGLRVSALPKTEAETLESALGKLDYDFPVCDHGKRAEWYISNCPLSDHC